MTQIAAIVIALVFGAVFCNCTPAPIADATQYGGRCMGMRPLCGPGLHPECICYDSFGNNCAWQCVR